MKITANWTREDERQAEGMANALETCETCETCGDGVLPDHPLCTACEKKRDQTRIPQQSGRGYVPGVRSPYRR